jgi:hypothetical protein
MAMKRISILICLCAAACGGGQGGPTVGATSAAYSEMTFTQRAVFMNDVVLPEMTKTFAAFDAKFADMTCATCHGDGAADGSFAMPNPKIAPLPSTEEAFAEYVKDPEHARWSQFMEGQVWPQMAGLLGTPMFDPATQTDGFSCHNCHTLDAVAR